METICMKCQIMFPGKNKKKSQFLLDALININEVYDIDKFSR